MGKKEKIPAPGAKTDKFTNFYSKSKWKQFFAKPTLELAGRNIQQRGALIIGNALAKNRMVTYVDFSHNHMGDGGAIEIAQILKVNEFIQNINLAHNEISDVGGIALASCFVPCANPTGQPSQWNRSVFYMNLSCNQLGDDTMLAFSNAAACHRDLSKVDLTWNRVGPAGTKCLLRSMQRNPFCTFALGANLVGDEGVEYLCEAWSRHGGKANAALQLFRNDISKNGADAIGRLVEGRGSEFIVDINLSCNTLGFKGAQLLCQRFIGSKNLVRYLNLSNNLIGDEGAEEVAQLLASNPESLTKLNVSSNEISDKGGAAIAHALNKNSTLLFLNLSENNFGQKTIDSLADPIRNTKSLKIIDLRKCLNTQDLRQQIMSISNENNNIRVDTGVSDEDIFGEMMAKISEHMQKIVEDEEKAKNKKGKKSKGGD